MANKHRHKPRPLFAEIRKRAKKAGQMPGTPTYTGDKSTTLPTITVLNYNVDHCELKKGHQLDEVLDTTLVNGITWVNLDGLSDTALVSNLAKRFHLHPLTVEDILNVDQRPKVEEFEGYVFITLKILMAEDNLTPASTKQLSLILGKDFVISFQETNSTIFDAFLSRIQVDPNQRVRQQGSDYLAYRLIDIVVDQYFVVLETLGDQIEILEQRIITNATPKNARTIYRVKQDLLVLRKAIWPMREALGHLMHGEDNLITKFTRVYLRDVYDHTLQAIDALETFRDMLASMLDMYLSSLTNRMNEIMKTLTIITTIFIPITSIASIYGMNFANMPGLQWRYGFTGVMIVMVLIAILMMIYFRKMKWV